MKNQIRLFLPCLFTLLPGCSWDSALYDKFVGDESNVVSCVGECMVQNQKISQSECTGDGLTWYEDQCINPANGTLLQDVKDENECKANKAAWRPAHCEVTSEFGCYKVKGEWTAYQYDLLDLGNGEYIRKMENGYACGKFDVVLKATTATTCPSDIIKTFETSSQFSICPKNAQNCATYNLPNNPEEDDGNDAITPHAMCSSCAEGMAVCYEKNKFQCVDLNTNANHCGICGQKCESTEDTPKSCIDGQCVEFKCEYTQCNDENHTCINPQDHETCGATCDKPKGTRCEIEKGLSCVIDKTSTEDNPSYKCDCASGILNNDGFCVNPASNETCGATQDNPMGRPCSSGLVCRPTNDEKSYACVCAKNWEELCHADEADYCIDPSTNHDHCGAKGEQACQNLSEFQCGPSQKCVNGNCECLPEFAACGDRCTDSSMDKDYCGAKGQCNDSNPDSPNYQGIACGPNAYCSKSQCTCERDYIMHNGECISPSYNEFCGASIVDGKFQPGQDCTKENRKSCQKLNNIFQCVCDHGYVECEGKCIDPKTNSQYCGASGDCQGPNQGNKCNGMVCSDGTCKTTCPSGSTLCAISATEKACISQTLSHLAIKDDNCFECNAEYCPTKNYNDEYFHEDRCVTEDNSNRLHSANHCSKCNDKCGDTYVCLPLPDGKYQCGCQDGYTECSIPGAENKCVDLKALHKTSCDECEAGWDDCNKDPVDGCEVQVSGDKSNCGTCGNECNQTFADKHVSGIVCLDGTCQSTGCEAGYGNCDGDNANGCETNLMTPEACGNCSNNCTLQYQTKDKNYTLSCVEGSCKTTCARGYANCDNKDHNGCETNITTTRNCGSCGNSCGRGYSCSEGHCCVQSSNSTYYSNIICCDKKYRKLTYDYWYDEYYYEYACAKQKPQKGYYDDYDWEEISQ